MENFPKWYRWRGGSALGYYWHDFTHSINLFRGFFTQVINKTPRNFIERYINKKVAAIYAVSLVILYSFGFTGFQMTGVQSVVKIFAKQNFNYNFTTKGRLIFIVIPIIVIVSSIVLTKSYKLFINVLGSLVSLLIILYVGFF